MTDPLATEVLRLCQVRAHTEPQIGAALNVPVTAVRSHVRALLALGLLAQEAPSRHNG